MAGVAHEVNVDAIPNVIPNPLCPFPYFPDALIFSLRFSQFWSVSFCGPAFGVGQEARWAAPGSFSTGLS